jgi:hypothetical protein
LDVLTLLLSLLEDAEGGLGTLNLLTLVREGASGMSDRSFDGVQLGLLCEHLGRKRLVDSFEDCTDVWTFSLGST